MQLSQLCFFPWLSIAWHTWLAPSGFLAADLFFLMSGFVIAHSYEDRIIQRGWRWLIKIRVIRFPRLYIIGGLLGL